MEDGPAKLARARENDIKAWLSVNERCPTCCVKIADIPDGSSLYPHMVGACDDREVFIGVGGVPRLGYRRDQPLADAVAREKPRSWLSRLLERFR